MAARLLAIVFLVGVFAAASTFQQVIDLQPDEISAASLDGIDDFDRAHFSVLVLPPPRQQVVIEWPSVLPNVRTQTLTVFRPPRLAASRCVES